MTDAEKNTQGEEKFRRFVKIFEDTSEASANMAAIAKKQIEIMNKQIEAVGKLTDISGAVFDAIAKPHDGVVSAIDDLIAEVQGLRDDLRVVAKAGGLSGLMSLLGGGRRR